MSEAKLKPVRVIRFDYPDANYVGWGFNHSGKRYFFSDEKYGDKAKQVAEEAAKGRYHKPRLRLVPQANNRSAISGVFKSQDRGRPYYVAYCGRRDQKKFFFEDGDGFSELAAACTATLRREEYENRLLKSGKVNVIKSRKQNGNTKN